jgi:uncharacterized iron-regulated membrane protein
VTGSVLVFDHDMDKAGNRAVFEIAGAGERASFDRIVASAGRAVPAVEGPHRLVVPEGPGWPLSVEYFHPGPDRFRGTQVLVDPVTAEVRTVREWGDWLASFIYRLHQALALGYSGETVVAVAGVLMLVSLISGLVVWWPRPGGWRRAFSPRLRRGRVSLWLDLHNRLGVYPCVALLVVTLTGVAMSWHDEVHHLVEATLPTRPHAETALPNPVPRSEWLPLDALVERARARFPGGELQRIRFPRQESGPLRIMLRQPYEVARTYGQTYVWLDPADGTILAAREPAGRPAGDALLGWIFPLHSGQAFALPGRLIVFATGLLPALLLVSGFIVWWRKGRGT